MPKVQLSAGFSNIKGIQGGSIWSENGGGLYFRKRTKFNRKSSKAWNRTKSTMTYLSAQWRTLTQAQKDAWAAATINYPTTDAFGNPRTPSAYELFIRLNFRFVDAGLPFNTLPPAPAPILNLGAVSAGINAVGLFEATWTNPLGATDGVLITASKPQSKGLGYRPGATKSMVSAVGVGLTSAVFDQQWLDAYGVKISSTRVWVGFKACSITSGDCGNVLTAFFDIP